MKVGLLGYRGLVGSALERRLRREDWELLTIGRDTYDRFRDHEFDILINAAMPSKRFWALNHPLDDFDATVRLTADLVFNWKFGKLVQISTVSSRLQRDHPYGLNKLCAETLVLNSHQDNLVFRLGGLFGDGLDKGAIVDIAMGRKLFVSGESKYHFISTAKAADIMVQRLQRTGTIGVGARDQISLREVADHFGLQPEFGDRYESQYAESPEADYPEAAEVLGFVRDLLAGAR